METTIPGVSLGTCPVCQAPQTRQYRAADDCACTMCYPCANAALAAGTCPRCGTVYAPDDAA